MSVYIQELARELGKQGVLVDIYTRIHDPKDPLIVDLGKNSRLIHLKAGGKKQLDKPQVYSCLAEFTRNLENFKERHNLRYDLILSHYWLSGIAGEYLQNRWAVPHIITFHTLGALKNATGIGGNEPKIRLKSERQLIKSCRLIIATTKKEKQDLISHYNASSQKIKVIPCGVNLNLFRPINKKVAKKQLGFGDNKVIIFVGRLEPLKGVDRLFEAVSYLKNPRLKTVIIGGDKSSQNEIRRLKAISHKLHLDDSVDFRGSIKQEKLPYFYSAADACVIPSYYESFGLVALESLACGTPIIAADVGDLKNIVRQGKTGYVVKNNNSRSLAAKMALLLAKSISAKSAVSIRASVTKFSWTKIARMIKCTLHSVRH